MKVDILKLTEPNTRTFIVVRAGSALRQAEMFKGYHLLKEGIDFDEGNNYIGLESVDQCLYEIIMKGYYQFTVSLRDAYNGM